MNDRFTYENPKDSSNEITVYVQDDEHWEREYIGWLRIAVSDEKAVDSYNSDFTCDIHLPIKTAKKLRDYLNSKFPE